MCETLKMVPVSNTECTLRVPCLEVRVCRRNDVKSHGLAAAVPDPDVLSNWRGGPIPAEVHPGWAGLKYPPATAFSEAACKHARHLPLIGVSSVSSQMEISTITPIYNKMQYDNTMYYTVTWTYDAFNVRNIMMPPQLMPSYHSY